MTVGVVGRYPATASDIDACVRATVGPLDRPLHVHINELHVGETWQSASSLNHAARPSFPRPVDHTVNP